MSKVKITPRMQSALDRIRAARERIDHLLTEAAAPMTYVSLDAINRDREQQGLAPIAPMPKGHA